MDGSRLPRRVCFPPPAGSPERFGRGAAGGDVVRRSLAFSTWRPAFLWRGRRDFRRHGVDVAAVFLDGQAGTLSAAGDDDALANLVAEPPPEFRAVARSLARRRDRL